MKGTNLTVPLKWQLVLITYVGHVPLYFYFDGLQCGLHDVLYAQQIIYRKEKKIQSDMTGDAISWKDGKRIMYLMWFGVLIPHLSFIWSIDSIKHSFALCYNLLLISKLDQCNGLIPSSKHRNRYLLPTHSLTPSLSLYHFSFHSQSSPSSFSVGFTHKANHLLPLRKTLLHKSLYPYTSTPPFTPFATSPIAWTSLSLYFSHFAIFSTSGVFNFLWR